MNGNSFFRVFLKQLVKILWGEIAVALSFGFVIVMMVQFGLLRHVDVYGRHLTRAGFLFHIFLIIAMVFCPIYIMLLTAKRMSNELRYIAECTSESDASEVQEFQNIISTMHALEQSLAEVKDEKNQMSAKNRLAVSQLCGNLEKQLYISYEYVKALESESLSEKQKESIEGLLDSMKDMQTMLHNQMDDLHNQREKKQVYLQDIVEECMEDCAYTMYEKQLTYKIVGNDNLSGIGELLPKQKIYRVMMNLLDTAISFAPEKGEIRIDLELKEDIVIAVCDGGVGFPKGVIAKFRNHERINEGLETAEKIANSMGGELCLSNTKHGGCASLILPII
ncbi:MAG: HAMP domain-containing histidine kinase [Lachnospiraceae bacterium]|nr:HAMP domain-containing histidine kinase [Lachnospiraceae bacterium]